MRVTNAIQRNTYKDETVIMKEVEEIQNREAEVPFATHKGISIFKNLWIESFRVQVGSSGGQLAHFDTVEEAKQFIDRLS